LLFVTCIQNAFSLEPLFASKFIKEHPMIKVPCITPLPPFIKGGMGGFLSLEERD
jgi:hypothetical protein